MAGVGIAYALIRVVGRYQQFFLSRLAPIELDAVTVLAGLGAGLAIGLIAAVLPRSVVNAAPNDVLRSSRGSAGDVKVDGDAHRDWWSRRSPSPSCCWSARDC